MIAVSLMGPSLTIPDTGRGGLWNHPLSAPVMVGVTWAFTLVGLLGVLLGLLAARRGGRLGWTGIFGLVSCAVLAVLPVAGSTDALSYAIYGRIGVLGHDPYLYTARQLYEAGDPVGLLAPVSWRGVPSAYGPVANWIFELCAQAGASMAVITLMIKLLTGAAFAATGIILAKLAEDPVRAHLLWTANPLLLWTLVASGHVDTIGAFLLVAALLLAYKRGFWGALGAGALLGLAASIKAPFGLAGLGFAWRDRRSAGRLAGLAAGFGAVVGAAYHFGSDRAFDVLLSKAGGTSWINPWGWPLRQLDLDSLSTGPSAKIGWIAAVVVAGLLAWRLPKDENVKPVFVVCAAFLITSPLLHPWYDAMMIPLLVLLAPSAYRTRLDVLILVRLAVAAFGYLPGVPTPSKLTTDTIIWVNGTFIPNVVAGALFFLVLTIVFALILPVRAKRG